MTRAQLYGPFGHRPPTRQRLRLGVDGEGRLTALAPSRQDRAPPVSTISTSAPPTPRTRSMRARRSARRTRRYGSTPARRCSCARPARPPARSRSKAPSTRWRRRRGIDPLHSACTNYAEAEPISGKPFSSKALRECFAHGAEAFGWARTAAWRRARCATRTACWSAGASAPRPSRRVMFQGERARRPQAPTGPARSRPARTTWARAPGPRWPRSPPTRWRCRSKGSSCARARPTCPTPGIAGGSGHTATAGARHPQRRRRCDRQTRRARDDDDPHRRSTAPAMPASSRATAGCMRRDDESRGESYADILARAGLAEIDGEGSGAADPAAQAQLRHARAWRGVRRGEGRSRSRHGARDAASSAPSRPAASSIRGWCTASISAA